MSIPQGSEFLLPNDFANSVISMGLKWDLFDRNDTVDLDASCVLFDSFGNILDAVFYNNTKSNDGSVSHSGDNKTGEGEGDDESILIYMQNIHPSVKVLMFNINCYSGGTFSKVETANVFVRNGNQVLSSLALGCQGDHTGFIMCMIYKRGNDWILRNISQRVEGKNFKDIEVDMKKSMEFLISKELQDEGSNWNPGKIFNLNKGDSLTVPVTDFTVGLGWDTGLGGVDLDSSCKMYDCNNTFVGDVWFNNKESTCKGVKHKGDNMTGSGDGDDEKIKVKVSKMSPKINTLVFAITIFSKGRNFSSVKNAYCRLIDNDTKSEMCRYKLSDFGHHNAVIMCVVYRTASLTWKIKAIGEAADGNYIGVLDHDCYSHVQKLALTGLKQPTQIEIDNYIQKTKESRKSAKLSAKGSLKTYSITVVEGKNLISKDSNGLSDPFVKVIFGKNSMKSLVVKKTLNPIWDYKFSTLRNEVISDSTNALHIQVWDWDMLKDDCMGEVRISTLKLKQLKDEGRLNDFWIDLKPREEKPDEAVSGSIRIKIIEN